MQTAMRVRPRDMARAPKREDNAVKIAYEVYREVKLVAAYKGMTIAEYVTSILADPVHKDHADMLAAESKRVAPPKSKQ